MAVPLARSGALSRVMALAAARVRIGAARRCLARAGAGQVRAFAVVSGAGALLLAYELGPQIQPYIEGNVVVQPTSSGPARLVRRIFHLLSGLPAAVDLVAVVGEPT
jgi:hypothetical protein